MYRFESEYEGEDDDGAECDPVIPEPTRYRSMPTTPAGRPVGFPPHAKRRRPMFESDVYNPYLTQSYEPEPHACYEEHDSEIRKLIASQDNMMRLLENVSGRVGVVESQLTTMKDPSPSSSGTSPEQKKRIPAQISVSKLNWYE